jgi:steroid delta-isomerase-like uncharacterized protein
MTREEMIGVVERLMRAKQAHDIDALLDIYSAECVLEQPSLGVRSVGRAAIRPGLERFAQAFPDYGRAFEGAAVDGDTLVSWGMAHMTLTGQFSGASPNGRRASVMTFVLFRFDEEGRIRYEGHYWDLASLCRQSGIAVETMWRAADPA